MLPVPSRNGKRFITARNGNGRKASSSGWNTWIATLRRAGVAPESRASSLLPRLGRPGAPTARLLCFSGAGFAAELRDEAAQSGEVRLLTPADLYSGILLQPRPSDGKWICLPPRRRSIATPVT
jgi:hypothetical protein